MTQRLGSELFELLQPLQGYAFMSDDYEDKTDAEIIELAENTLNLESEIVKTLRKFLRNHNKDTWVIYVYCNFCGRNAPKYGPCPVCGKYQD